MSSPCFNEFTIEGDPDRVQGVAASLRGQYSDGKECLFAFDKVLPIPPDPPPLWLENNWGTYRYPIDCTIDSDGSDGKFVMWLQSFNLPPNGVVATLAERNPDLRFELTWEQPDWSTGGRAVFAEGELVEDDYWEEDEELEDDDVEGAASEPSEEEPTPPTALGRRSRTSLSAAAERPLRSLEPGPHSGAG